MKNRTPHEDGAFFMAKDFSNYNNVSLGLRDNNPGNIIYDGTQWQGMTGVNSGFVTFKNIDYGIRALGIDLTTKINEGYDTITLIINRYAPQSAGNDPVSYIQIVSQMSGFVPDQILIATGDTLLKLIKGIILVETGSSSASLISDDDIKEGLAMIPEMSFAVGIGASAVLLAFAAWAIFKKKV